MPEFAQFRLFSCELLQRPFLFESYYEWRSVLEHLFSDLEDILDDFDAVASLQPQILLGAVQDDLVGKSGDGELFDGVDGQSALEGVAVEQVQGE